MAKSQIGEIKRIILFDGECNLCNRFARFIASRDSKKSFALAPLQWGILVGLVDQNQRRDSIVLLEGNHKFTESDALIRICRNLCFPWPLLQVFVIVPRPLRNSFYRWIALHRMRWFGRSLVCPLPEPGINAKTRSSS